MDRKAVNIETLRGITIILVVIGHVIGSTPDGGMRIEYPSIWRYLYLWIDYIQMPLFTAIAGWVYSLKPIKHTFIKKFITKKIYRLLIPMISIGTIYFLVQYIIPGTNSKGNLSDIWKIYLFPYTIYWYLPSLFIMFMMIAIIDFKKWAYQFSGWIYCTIIAYLLMIVQQNIISDNISNLFSFKGALLLFPYFIIGVGIQRFKNQLFSCNQKKIYLLFASIGIILCSLEWFYPLQEYQIYKNLQPLCIIALLALLLHQNHSYRSLTWIGGYTYSIYLFHGFGTSGGRIILSYIGIQNQIIVFMVSTGIALLCPILVGNILFRWKITKFIFLGKNNLT